MDRCISGEAERRFIRFIGVLVFLWCFGVLFPLTISFFGTSRTLVNNFLIPLSSRFYTHEIVLLFL